MKQRWVRQQKEDEEKDKVDDKRERTEQQQKEMALLKLEADEGLLMMNAPKNVATETEPKATADSSEQTETHTGSKETQTQATAGSLELDARVFSENAISEASLKDSDAQTRFYTGLPKWAFVVQVLSLLSPFITPSRIKTNP